MNLAQARKTLNELKAKTAPPKYVVWYADSEPAPVNVDENTIIIKVVYIDHPPPDSPEVGLL